MNTFPLDNERKNMRIGVRGLPGLMDRLEGGKAKDLKL